MGNYYRDAVARYGLRVYCASCFARGRHRPESDGRLRLRPCPRCNARTLRSEAWKARYPGRALMLERELEEERRARP